MKPESIKVKPETYKRIKEIAKKMRRTIQTTIDIIVGRFKG
jgi:predicted transcriptional regulator